jgi:hypothetical protein
VNSKNWCLVCGVWIDTGQIYCEKHGGAPEQPSLREIIKMEFSQHDRGEAGRPEHVALEGKEAL